MIVKTPFSNDVACHLTGILSHTLTQPEQGEVSPRRPPLGGEVQQIVDFLPREQLVISRGDLATAGSLRSILSLALTCGDLL